MGRRFKWISLSLLFSLISSMFITAVVVLIDKGPRFLTQASMIELKEDKEQIKNKSKEPVEDTVKSLKLINPKYSIPDQYILDVSAISQKPELYNGCEVTTLAMLARYLKLPYTKLELAEMIQKDSTPVTYQNGKIIRWGDPNRGFVGDIYGRKMGYGVYVKPLKDLLNQIYDQQAKDLTGSDVETIKRSIADNKPVIVWTTINFLPVEKWVKWKTPAGKVVQATFKEHTVLVVGYDKNFIYVNNPYNGKKSQKIAIERFKKSWEQFGRLALTIR